jgi:hypothetical protein
MKKIICVIVIIICVIMVQAQPPIALTINTNTAFKDVTITTNTLGTYLLQINGTKPLVKFSEVGTNYDFKKVNYFSFDYKATARVTDVKLYFDSALKMQPILCEAFKPADSFKTVIFRLSESLDFKQAFKNFYINFGKISGKSIVIKNIQLRAATKAEMADEPIYIDNGNVRLGVDVTGGGSVFYFAESATRRNLLNHADKGRFVQQSYYGAKDGSIWGKKPWAWNPVQGGGSSESGSSPAKVLEKKVTKNTIYIKSLPKHWATGVDIEDAIMEESITLKKNIAHIVYTFKYNGIVQHPIKPQELPAVFVDYALPNLVFYKADKPWTKDTLTSVVPGWPNESQKMNENWAAYVDDVQWGIGVYVPGTNIMTTYRHSGDLVTGPYGGACSYLAPVRKFSIKPGFVFTYDVYLIIDKLTEIREAFYKIHSKK